MLFQLFSIKVLPHFINKTFESETGNANQKLFSDDHISAIIK